MCIIMIGDKKRVKRRGKREQDKKNRKKENKKWVERIRIHRKKRSTIFPSPAGDVTNQTLTGQE